MKKKIGKKAFKVSLLSLCMMLASLAYSVAASAAGAASYWNAYQPEEPQDVRYLVK